MNRTKKQWLTGVAATSIGLVLISAFSVGPIASAGASSPKKGGTVVFGESAPVQSLDPATINGVSIGGVEANAVYGTLLVDSTTAKADVPSLAKSLTHNASFSVWTLTLRPNGKFSDGEPFDAQAVVGDFNRLLNPATHTVNTAVLKASTVTSVVASGTNTVTFTLSSPDADFPAVLAGTAGWVGAPKYLAELAAGQPNATAIGAGPFKVSSFTPGSELSLVKNKNYMLGAPYLDGITFEYLGGALNNNQAFDTGEIQAAIYGGGDVVALGQIEEQNPHLLNSVTNAGDAVVFNTASSSVFSNVKLREAVDMGVSPEYWAIHANDGVGALGATDRLFPKGSQWYSPKMNGVPYDPTEAAQLVSQVKAATGWNGDVTYICQDTTSTAAYGTAMAAMLDPLGFNVIAPSGITTSQWITDLEVTHAFDLACWTASGLESDPYSGMSALLGPGASTNVGQYTSPGWTAGLQALRLATTHAQKEAALIQMNNAWNQTYPMANLGIQSDVVIFSPNLHGIVQTDIHGTVSFAKAWLS